MKFSSDELMPFSEVRTGMSQFLVEAQAGKEFVITRHGKPIAALLSAAQLFRYRELERLLGEYVALSKTEPSSSQLNEALALLQHKIEQLPIKQEKQQSWAKKLHKHNG